LKSVGAQHERRLVSGGKWRLQAEKHRWDKEKNVNVERSPWRKYKDPHKKQSTTSVPTLTEGRE